MDTDTMEKINELIRIQKQNFDLEKEHKKITDNLVDTIDRALNLIDILTTKVKTLDEEIHKKHDIKIHYHTDRYPEMIPSIEKHGNFYDLSTAESVELFEGYHKLIPLGVSINLPDGYYAILLPRSSTFKKYGILVANSTGIIDSDYRGMNDIWMLSVYPTKHTIIPANERIAQFTIVRENKFDLVEADWEATNRGGFGSSDKK